MDFKVRAANAVCFSTQSSGIAKLPTADYAPLAQASQAGAIKQAQGGENASRGSAIRLLAFFPQEPNSNELELIQSHMAQKPMLRGEVGAHFV